VTAAKQLNERRRRGNSHPPSARRRCCYRNCRVTAWSWRHRPAPLQRPPVRRRQTGHDHLDLRRL
jgi:hypothetical protein